MLNSAWDVKDGMSGCPECQNVTFCPDSLKYKHVLSYLSWVDWAWMDDSPEELSIKSLSNLPGGFWNKSFSLFLLVSFAEKFKVSHKHTHWPAQMGLLPVTFFEQYLLLSWTSCSVLSFGWAWSYSLSGYKRRDCSRPSLRAFTEVGANSKQSNPL